MNDLTETVCKFDSSSIATLFELGGDTDAQSSEATPESVEHLMSIPIKYALNRLPRRLADKLRLRAREIQLSRYARESGINTFDDLFKHVHPSPALLMFAKEFGKAIVAHGGTVWPRGVGEVLYYAAYAAALVRGHDRIGNLSKADLQAGFRQLFSRPWITGEMKDLFDKASVRLSGARNPAIVPRIDGGHQWRGVRDTRR